MVEIVEVRAGSRADRAGVRPGDLLISIGENPIRDVLDYRFYLAECQVELRILREGEEHRFLIRKGEYDDIGLSFATPLMDKKHTCRNGCVFCFVDQMPKGLRESLYFKDDDDRLSFLHGNYVTLTNLGEEDIDRLIKMHISPINVSVHTTNPELRVRMMKNKHAGEVLSYLRRLADAGIALCTQIVLCRGLNDGEELVRSMRDLESYYPALRSCAIVPVGLTRYRDGLYPLTLFSPEEAREVIRTVNAFGDECKRKYGTRLFYCADELYITAGEPLPGKDYYEEYSQLENGVGMLTSLSDEFAGELEFLSELLPEARLPRRVSVATGVAAYDSLSRLCAALSATAPGLEICVHRIVNHFFGETVTVAGLLTGTDLSQQLVGKELGEELFIPQAMLRADGDLFLDDMRPEELAERLGVRVTPVGNDGVELIHRLLGIE